MFKNSQLISLKQKKKKKKVKKEQVFFESFERRIRKSERELICFFVVDRNLLNKIDSIKSAIGSAASFLVD